LVAYRAHQETIQATTQFARTALHYPFHKHYRTWWPAANVDRWNEDNATDTFFLDTPAHDDGIFGHSGCTMAQIYAGKNSSKLVAYGMNSESQMPSTLKDLIPKHGAPNCLFSDNAKVQIGKCVHDILRLYSIKDFQCEPEYQHQNFAERKIGDVKRLSSSIMDRTGTPAAFWLLCLFYVIFLLNHMSSDALGGITPIEEATCVKGNISPLLKFHWWEPVLYQAEGAFLPIVKKSKAPGLGFLKIKTMSLHSLFSLTILAKSLLVPTFAPPTILIIRIYVRKLVLGRQVFPVPFLLCSLHPI
jgi:hypothetical protein